MTQTWSFCRQEHWDHVVRRKEVEMELPSVSSEVLRRREESREEWVVTFTNKITKVIIKLKRIPGIVSFYRFSVTKVNETEGTALLPSMSHDMA